MITECFDTIGSFGFHLAPPGAFKCDYGYSADVTECQDAVLAFATAAGATPGRSLQVGEGGTCLDHSWGEAPLGCSAQTGAGVDVDDLRYQGSDWAAHYKLGDIDSGDGCNKGQFQLVCTNHGMLYFH